MGSAPLARDSPTQTVLLEHYFSMTLSKCYRSSAEALRCGTCHNPHRQPSGAGAVAQYRTRCLGCHEAHPCKLSLEERRKTSPAGDCASCHMPKRMVTTITHAALTNHWIHIRPGEPLPEEAFRAPADSGLLHLTAAPGDNQPAIPPVTLLRAWASLVRDGHNELRPRMNDLLDRLAREMPSNPHVLSELARRASAERTPQRSEEAIRYLERELRAGSVSPEDFLLLAELYARVHKDSEALGALRKGMLENPYAREFPEAIAARYVALGQYRDALEFIRNGLELFPDDATLRLLEKQVRAATLE